ncbi:selenocysteine-specific translation elongation factor [Cryptosporangium sp. NPDC048952]|uniref:selenocysteine-specific translation elongation factor n=1 Tax=Cryptosporangium sp. NPDC048952 TaxID=3363961 RepID=UPI0037204816
MHVVATAGHVDHGKSTLVRALTGMEPDRWAEERRRGMTIDLGFAWTRLPGGAEVAFVDVPGHERFVPNMLAGVGPVPAAMLVVAADSGWMPQTAEHVAALDALGVSHAVLAVTRSDLADPEPAIAEVRAELRGTSLDGLPAVAVSGVTGLGLEELRARLSELVEALPAPDVSRPVRLWVDRSFTIRGSGTVVTGTLSAGSLRVGDELVLNGRSVHVRGLQALGVAHETVTAVARVAVNVRNVDKNDVGRGDALLTPGAWRSTALIDVRVDGDDLDAAPTELTLHVGSAAIPVRVRPLGTGPVPTGPVPTRPVPTGPVPTRPVPTGPVPTRSGPSERDHSAALAGAASDGREERAQFARLTLAGPLPLAARDRALLRDPGAHRVIGRVTVLDTDPPLLSRRGAAAARAAQLAGGVGPDLLQSRGVLRVAELTGLGAVPPDDAVRAGEWLVAASHAAELRERLAKLIAEHRGTGSLEAGPTVDAARIALRLPDRVIVLALVRAPLTVRDGRIVDRDAPPPLPPNVRAAVETVTEELAHTPFRAPEANRLTALGLGPRELAAAERAGALLRLADNVVLLPGADDQAIQVLRTLDQPFTTSQARQALDTSRRVVLPLLALLDRQLRTRRHPDDRREVTSSENAP